MSDATAPLAHLQIAMSQAVDLARALPEDSANRDYEELIATYLCQVLDALRKARP